MASRDARGFIELLLHRSGAGIGGECRAHPGFGRFQRSLENLIALRYFQFRGALLVNVWLAKSLEQAVQAFDNGCTVASAVRPNMSRSACSSGMCLAVPGLVWFLGGVVSAQNLSPNGPADRFTETREYDSVVDFTTATATFRVDGDDGIMIQFVTVHQGTTPRAPKAVEVLIIREFSGVPSGPGIDPERHVALRVDGERFERRGTLNRRHIDRPQSAAVAIVFRAYALSRFADVTSLEGHAFGCDFALAADQVVELRSIMQQWIARPR